MKSAFALHSLPLGNALLNQESQEYNARLAKLNQIQEIMDDFALESKKQVSISSKLAIIYATETQDMIPQIVQDFAELAQDFFEVSLLDLNALENFSGQFGNFSAYFNNGNVVEFSQAVLFVEEAELARFRGVYNVADFANAQILLEVLRQNIGEYGYKEIISYKEESCQYHHRREKYCAKCVEVCPTFGVGGNDSLMELVFSPIDCIACGACAEACPCSCITEGDGKYVINADECVSCGSCAATCPVGAPVEE